MHSEGAVLNSLGISGEGGPVPANVAVAGANTPGSRKLLASATCNHQDRSNDESAPEKVDTTRYQQSSLMFLHRNRMNVFVHSGD